MTQRDTRPGNRQAIDPGPMSEAERDRQKDRDIVKRAEVALRELEMSAIIQADKTRIDRVWRGLRSLDDEQADSKADRDAAIARAEKAEAFKAYVHKRLDDAGVPADPPSPHREQGCRIGGRLDLALAALAQVQQLRDLAENAWAVIANAGWRGEEKSAGWDDAAAQWRGRYHREVLGIDSPNDPRSQWVKHAFAATEAKP